MYGYLPPDHFVKHQQKIADQNIYFKQNMAGNYMNSVVSTGYDETHFHGIRKHNESYKRELSPLPPLISLNPYATQHSNHPYNVLFSNNQFPWKFNDSQYLPTSMTHVSEAISDRQNVIGSPSISSDGRQSTISTASSNDSQTSNVPLSSPLSDKFVPSPISSAENDEENDEYLDVETLNDDTVNADTKERQDYEMISDVTLIKKERSKNSNRNKLWKFLLKLLEEDKEEFYIRWTNKSQGEFRMIKTAAVAALWGRSNNRKNMTYEKMTRAMRYYYKMKVIKKVPHKNLHYQFGPSVMSKVVFNEPSTTKKTLTNSILTEYDKKLNRESVTDAKIKLKPLIVNSPTTEQVIDNRYQLIGGQNKTRIIFPTQFRNPFL